jgi:hypothetical protein
LRALKGATVDLRTLVGKDWDDTLRPDRFPHVESTLGSSGKVASTTTRRGQMLIQKKKADKKPRLDTPVVSKPPPRPQSSFPPPSAAASTNRPQTPLFPTSISSFSPSDLAAFLNLLAPLHNFTSSSPILHAVGLASLETVTCFVVAEASMVEAAIEALVQGGKLEENEGKWVVHAFEMAKREWRREERS